VRTKTGPVRIPVIRNLLLCSSRSPVMSPVIVLLVLRVRRMSLAHHSLASWTWAMSDASITAGSMKPAGLASIDACRNESECRRRGPRVWHFRGCRARLREPVPAPAAAAATDGCQHPTWVMVWRTGRRGSQCTCCAWKTCAGRLSFARTRQRSCSRGALGRAQRFGLLQAPSPNIFFLFYGGNGVGDRQKPIPCFVGESLLSRMVPPLSSISRKCITWILYCSYYIHCITVERSAKNPRL